MSYRNPTSIHIGMAGTLADKRFKVVGRGVLGMEEDGETYFWHEFYLMSDDEEEATLVYEQTENGAEWRLFRYFEPDYPITASDAASKRVGDWLNLDGTDVRVTLVDESQVYFLEGRAPEGVEAGDIARYFNAEGRKGLIVVSWTGEEVECYRGLDLSWGLVRSAFGLPEFQQEQGIRLSNREGSSLPSSLSAAATRTLAIAGVVVLALLIYVLVRPAKGPDHLIKLKEPQLKLVGKTGKLRGQCYYVHHRALWEIASVGRRYQQHEYEIENESGQPCLLICGFNPGTDDWFLLTPIQPQKTLSPVAEALHRTGDIVPLNDKKATVRELFVATMNVPGQTVPHKNLVSHGFRADAGETIFLERWTEQEVFLYEGSRISLLEVSEGFKPAK